MKNWLWAHVTRSTSQHFTRIHSLLLGPLLLLPIVYYSPMRLPLPAFRPNDHGLPSERRWRRSEPCFEQISVSVRRGHRQIWEHIVSISLDTNESFLCDAIYFSVEAWAEDASVWAVLICSHICVLLHAIVSVNYSFGSPFSHIV